MKTPITLISVYALSFVFLAFSTKPAAEPFKRPSYSQTVNITLDFVMMVHDRHHGNVTWAELNAEVCQAMHVKRTEPWDEQR